MVVSADRFSPPSGESSVTTGAAFVYADGFIEGMAEILPAASYILTEK